MKTDNSCFYMPNRLIQTSQTGGQPYSDTSPFSIPWLRVDFVPVVINKCCLSRVIHYCGKMFHWKGPSCEWFITFFLRHRHWEKIGENDIFLRKVEHLWIRQFPHLPVAFCKHSSLFCHTSSCTDVKDGEILEQENRLEMVDNLVLWQLTESQQGKWR